MYNLIPRLPSIREQLLRVMTFDLCLTLRGSKIITHNNCSCTEGSLGMRLGNVQIHAHVPSSGQCIVVLWTSTWTSGIHVHGACTHVYSMCNVGKYMLYIEHFSDHRSISLYGEVCDLCMTHWMTFQPISCVLVQWSVEYSRQEGNKAYTIQCIFD